MAYTPTHCGLEVDNSWWMGGEGNWCYKWKSFNKGIREIPEQLVQKMSESLFVIQLVVLNIYTQYSENELSHCLLFNLELLNIYT